VSGVDVQQRRHRAEHSPVANPREEHGRGVLAGHTHGQRLGPGGKGLPLSVGGQLPAAQFGLLGFQRRELGGGALVCRVETLLAFLLDGDRRLERGEIALGGGGPLLRLGDDVAQPSDLGLEGFDP
jgi:hypothetical protein